MREAVAGKLVGSRMKRVEDRRLLTGQGTYIDDVVVPDMLHAAFLRSPHPHAHIRSVDTSAALAAPGVVGVLTGADIFTLTNPLMGMLSLKGLYDPPQWALAVDRVRLVGDPVAIVVAESRALAEDACELIDVDYEPIEAVATMDQALDPARPAIWPKAKGNVLYQASETHGDVDGAFARADRVIRQRFAQHRHSHQPMETRGSVAEVDPATGNLTVHSAHQAAHVLKWTLAMAVGRQRPRDSLVGMVRQREHTKKILAGIRSFLKANPTLLRDMRPVFPVMAKGAIQDFARLRHLNRGIANLMGMDPARHPRIVLGDIGGAFGAKTTIPREEVAVCAAAVHLGRSIKWIEDRNENLVSGAQAREEAIDVEAAVTNDGTILGVRATLTMDAGAYPGVPYGGPLCARIVKIMFPGPYRIPALRFDTRMVASNKGTYTTYRGPWAVETWVRERLLDTIARELGLNRAEVHLRNIIGPDELPTTMVTGLTLDVRMSAKATLEQALRIADFDSWERHQRAARAEGRRLGLGFATYIEPAPGPAGYLDHVAPGFTAMAGIEPAHTVLEADGSVSVHTQQVPHGQGHETTLAQVAADELGVPASAVTVRYGDTKVAPFGVIGTGGSRSAAMAGGAVTLAARGLHDEVVRIAADLFEAAPDDIVIEDGAISVRGVPARTLGFGDVAAEAKRRGAPAVGDEALRVTRHYDGGEGGWAQSTHVCWVEVDLDTGQVRIPRYVVVEDCGEIINPAIVEGQIRGGIAQGVGAVLYEKTVYDESGQPQAGTFMDYLIPTVMEIPEIEIHHVETPSDIPFNYRGVGEGGMIGAPAAITNAIEDALADLGVRITEQHLPPTRILELAGIIPTA
ncbi:MAG: xanthine dehydrogenase family protein molybdopterin-binding subunit [Acidimicrobiia bacterium]